MRGYLNYLITNFKKGNYTTGSLIITTIIIYITTLTIGVMYKKISIILLSHVWIFIGGAICITWMDYWYKKNKW